MKIDSDASLRMKIAIGDQFFQIQTLQDQVEQLQAQILGRDATIAEHIAGIANRDAMLQERDAKIAAFIAAAAPETPVELDAAAED
jgi:hypothetical protein